MEDPRLDASVLLAELPFINRKRRPSFGFHIQSWGFDATLNLRVESRRRRSYETPRVVGWEGLTEVAICRPRDDKPSRS